jgi:hypothetical protein
MKLLGDREVVAVVLSGSDPHQVLLSILPVSAFRAYGLGATNSEISYHTRSWLRAAELGHPCGQLGVERDLDTRCH